MRGRRGNCCQNFLQPQRQTMVFGLAALSLLLACSAPLRAQSEAFRISSPIFPNGGAIPKQFTCDGPDVSPQLSWTAPPVGTVTFALLVDDPDAPAGNWNHWVIWNVPASARSLPEGVSKSRHLPDGSTQGLNDFRKVGYNGPCPPANKSHRYHFQIFALDRKLTLTGDAGKSELEAASKGHVLAQAEWMGTFRH